MMKEKRTADEMFPVVEAYLGSELTQKDFSAEHTGQIQDADHMIPREVFTLVRNWGELCFPHSISLSTGIMTSAI